MQIAKRTFEAKKHLPGSAERQRLNEDWRTSEYMPSHRFGIVRINGEQLPFTFRTKAEAERKIAELAEARDATQ